MKRLARSTGSESSLTDAVDGTSLDSVSVGGYPQVQDRALKTVKELDPSRLSTVSNSSSSSNGSK